MQGERAFGIDNLKYIAGVTTGFLALTAGLRFLSWQDFDANKLRALVLRGGESFDIYLRQERFDGKIITNITRHPALDFRPNISPDGSRIVFISNRDGNYEIYMMDFAKMTLTQITDTSDQEFEPVFSPDGARIAFVRGDFNKSDVYVMNLDDLQTIQITDDEATEHLLRWLDDNISFYRCETTGAWPFWHCGLGMSVVEVPEP